MFEDYIAAKGLNRSLQREEIGNVFLAAERHLTADELCRTCKQCE